MPLTTNPLFIQNQTHERRANHLHGLHALLSNEQEKMLCYPSHLNRGGNNISNGKRTFKNKCHNLCYTILFVCEFL